MASLVSLNSSLGRRSWRGRRAARLMPSSFCPASGRPTAPPSRSAATSSLLGYQATGWNRGRNIRPAGADLPAVAAQIRSLREATGTPVSLVGWSRGGIIAREAARLAPDATRMVDHSGQSVRRAGGVECRRRLAPPDRRGFPRADEGADARLGGADARSKHLDLQSLGRRRGLASMPATERTSKRKRRSSRLAPRSRLQSRGALGHCGPAGPASRRMGAVPAESPQSTAFFPRRPGRVIPTAASLTFPRRF